MPKPLKQPTADAVAQAITPLATEYYTANKEANAASGKAKKARSALFSTLLKLECKEKEITTVIDGKAVSLRVSIDTPSRDVVDLAELRKLVSEEVFLKVISASKSAVVDACGEAIALRVCRPAEGSPAVNVKPL